MPRYVETLRFMVHQWECDEFGHVNVRAYMGWVADAALSRLSALGFDHAVASRQGLGFAGVRAEVDFLHELNGGDVVRMETALETVGERKLTFRHRMRRVGDEVEVLAARITVVCLDLEARRARPFPEAVRDRLTAAMQSEAT